MKMDYNLPGLKLTSSDIWTRDEYEHLILAAKVAYQLGVQHGQDQNFVENEEYFDRWLHLGQE